MSLLPMCHLQFASIVTKAPSCAKRLQGQSSIVTRSYWLIFGRESTHAPVFLFGRSSRWTAFCLKLERSPCGFLLECGHGVWELILKNSKNRQLQAFPCLVDVHVVGAKYHEGSFSDQNVWRPWQIENLVFGLLFCILWSILGFGSALTKDNRPFRVAPIDAERKQAGKFVQEKLFLLVETVCHAD